MNNESPPKRAPRPEYWKAYGLKRRQDPVYRAMHNELHKKWTKQPDQAKRTAARMRRYIQDPILKIRHRARWKARAAVKAGKLKRQPCAECGELKTQMHHADYSKPLDVIWLCEKCHRAVHHNNS